MIDELSDYFFLVDASGDNPVDFLLVVVFG